MRENEVRGLSFTRQIMDPDLTKRPFGTRCSLPLLASIISFSISSCGIWEKECEPLNGSDDLAELHMRGDVKELSQRYYKAKGSRKDPKKGERAGPPFYNKELRFDGNGMRTWRRFVEEKKSKKKDWTVWKYDEHGKLQEKIRKSLDGKLIWKEEHFYDAQGRKIKKVRWNGEGQKLLKLRVERDDEGKVVEESLYSASEDLQQRTHYLRDTSGTIVRKTQYDEDGKELGRYTFERDEQGRPIEIKRFGKEGELLSWREYEYNEEGHLARETHRDTSKKAKKHVEYRYEYDGHCNWTRRVAIENGDPHRITVRDLKYE